MKYVLPFFIFSLFACSQPQQLADDTALAGKNCDYNNFKTLGDYQAGGVQMIDLVEGYKVWMYQI
tara:strand:+ start:329 stop:523 length:195 start_codon:yes stop_codon:yes gene_type:complete